MHLQGPKRLFVDYGKRAVAVWGMLLLALVQMVLRTVLLVVWEMAE